MPAGHLITGATGEEAAARFLTRKGYVILEKNWRHKSYELDVVCRAPGAEKRLLGRWLGKRGAETGDLVFVEVKTRSDSAFGGLDGARAAFDKGKQGRLARAVALYLTEHDAWSEACRVDLVCVCLEDAGYKVEHYENVLDFGNALGGGDAAWQPW